MPQPTLRPQDVLVLAKLLSYRGPRPPMAQMGIDLSISSSEVHAALKRLVLSRLVSSGAPGNRPLPEAAQRHHHFYGDTLKGGCPVGSGKMLTLSQVADELSRRLSRIFLPDATGRRPVHGDEARYAKDPGFKDLVLFYEYFNGDDGRGVGASHQTGCTTLVTRCIAHVTAVRSTKNQQTTA